MTLCHNSPADAFFFFFALLCSSSVVSTRQAGRQAGDRIGIGASCSCWPPRHITPDRRREISLSDARTHPVHVTNTLLMGGHLSSILGPAQWGVGGGGGWLGCPNCPPRTARVPTGRLGSLMARPPKPWGTCNGTCEFTASIGTFCIDSCREQIKKKEEKKRQNKTGFRKETSASRSGWR